MPDGDVASALREACLGPFDLAWLLERAADYGQETPTWQNADHKTVWKQGKVPPPIQLLVPESILFHGDKPHCLFFTDCAGFLRASVRALKQPHVVYQCMEQILKQRKDFEYREVDHLDITSSRRNSRSSDVSELKAALRKPRATVSMKHAPTLRKTWWRLWVEHRPQPMSEHDVAERLAGTRGLGWPNGSQLLQASFWNTPKFITYSYDATQSEAKGAVHTRLEDIIVNHFERFAFLDSVRDRNKISAVPNLLAQHLAYYCNLELVSGKFTFYKDRRSQLWLVDAKDLLLVPNGPHRGQSKLGGTASEALPQKLFRYLSEEALQNLPVDEQDGPKHQRMFELMISYYRSMKQQLGVDRRLQKVQQELDTNVPVLEGTDVKALTKTFDLKSSKFRGSASRDGPLRQIQVPPKRAGVRPSRGCRWYTAEAASHVKPSTGQRHGKHMAAIIARQREQEEESLDGPSVEEQKTQRSVRESEVRGSKTRTLPGTERKAIKIEIVCTAVATDLLEGAGTGACPEGSTMDLLKPRICPPGEGLQMTRKNAVPCARAVMVPPGAAAEATARLKEATEAEKEAALQDLQEQLFDQKQEQREGGAKGNGTGTTPRGSILGVRDAAENHEAGDTGQHRTPQELVDMPLKHHICLADCLSGRCWKYTSS